VDLGNLSIDEHYYTGGETGVQPAGTGSIFHDEGKYLYSMAAEQGGPVLVLGVARGVSDRYILSGLQNRGGGLLLCADIVPYWSKEDANAWIAQKCSNCTRLFFQHDSSRIDELAAIAQFKDRIKWCFIDADHRYEAVLKDMELCERLGIKLLVHHDTATRAQQVGYNEPRKAIDEFMKARPEWRVTRDCEELCGLLTMERD
jgi:Methyltransferase domain